MASRGNAGAIFVEKNWKLLSVKQAERISPRQVEGASSRWDRKAQVGHWWQCTKINRRTMLCRVNAHKPRICSEFPWYGKDIANADELVSMPQCGYMLRKTLVDMVTTA